MAGYSGPPYRRRHLSRFAPLFYYYYYRTNKNCYYYYLVVERKNKVS